LETTISGRGRENGRGREEEGERVTEVESKEIKTGSEKGEMGRK
jgi:hypothetical protein